MRKLFAAGALLALLVTNTGCGANIGLSYLVDIPFLRGNNDDIIASRPLSPPQTSARYTLASGPMRVICQTETAVPRIELTRQATFDGAQRMLIGFMAVSETIAAVMLAREGVVNGGAGFWTGAAIVQADALVALGHAIFAPSKGRTKRSIARGLPERTGDCPSGLTVVTGGRQIPVDSYGRLPNGRNAAGWAVDFGASISFGGQISMWFPTAADRCRLAHESGHPRLPALCQSPGANHGPTPLPPPPRAGWPTGGRWNGSVSFP